MKIKLDLSPIIKTKRKKSLKRSSLSKQSKRVISFPSLDPLPKIPPLFIKPLKLKSHIVFREEEKTMPKIDRDTVEFKGRKYQFTTPSNIQKIVSILNSNGGKCYIVGGWVRDILLNKQPKDIDIEVHGLTPTSISSILKSHGYHVDDVGKSFGVLKVKDPQTHEIFDISVPRSDSTGRKPVVTLLHNPTPKEAASRRDFTINSIMFDTKDQEIVDPFSGISDLESGRIRHVSSSTFTDDPLRAIRASQFASRFGFEIDPDTISLAKQVDTSQMAPERVTEEMRKALEKSHKPSIFFRKLDEMGQLERLFPEVKQLQSVEQDKIHHPEGNVFIHSMDVMDRISASDKRKLVSLVAALLHDLGKINKSYEDPVTKRIHAKGHEEESEKMAAKILEKYKFSSTEIKQILIIVRNHMKPHALVNSDALHLRNKQKLLRDICTTRNLMKDPKGSIDTYCDVIEFAKRDHTKYPEKYDELKELPPLEHYIPQITGQDLYDQGYRGEEIGKLLEEKYLNQIGHVKKKDNQ